MTTQMKKIAPEFPHQLRALQRNLLAKVPGNAYLFLGFVIMIVTVGECSTMEQKYV